MTLWVFTDFTTVLASAVPWNCAETEFVTVPSEFCDFQAMIATSVPVIDFVFFSSLVADFPLGGESLAGCSRVLPVSEETTALLHQSA